MNLILASSYPRRYQLLKDAGLTFKVIKPHVEETIPRKFNIYKVAECLAKIKSNSLPEPKSNEVIITADTVVILGKKILGKPKNKRQAVKMLMSLSARCHSVVTGVCLRSATKSISFSEKSKVFFHKVKPNEIIYYVNNFCPYDKAGAYGIQDWFGLRFIKRVEGCFYNVMGLPVSRVLAELEKMKLLMETQKLN